MKKNPKTSSTPNNDSQAGDPNGSFAVGFLLGAVGAAAGMWFVRTDQGKKVYQALKKEFLDEIVPEILPDKESQSDEPKKAKSSWHSKFPKFGRKS